MRLALRIFVLPLAASIVACASLPPPSPVVAQSRAIDLRLGGH